METKCRKLKNALSVSARYNDDNEDGNTFSLNTIIAAAAGGGVSLVAVIIIIVLCIKRRRDKEIMKENNKRMVAMKQDMDEAKQKRDSNGGEYDDLDYPVQYE